MTACAAGKVAAGQEPIPAETMGPNSMFRQSKFADEVSDWLQNRATSTEAERFHRYVTLIEQAAAGSASATPSPATQQTISKFRPASSLGFSAKNPACQSGAACSTGTNHNRPATASPSSWSHTSTKAAATQHALSINAAKAPAEFTTSASGQPGKHTISPAAADVQQPAIRSRSRSAATGACSSPRCVNVTTAQAYHGLKELYPELWASTVPICRPDAAPNKNFISEWGQSLQQGAVEAWAPYLASTYQVANLQVAKPTDEYAVRADEALVNWSAKQKLYYGDMLTPQAASAVQKLLEGNQQQQQQQQSEAGVGAAVPEVRLATAGLPVTGKKELVEMLRQVNAVVLPDSTKSMCHALHKRQYTVEDTATTSLMKEQTRIKTMGFPRKVDVKGFTHSAPTASINNRAASAGPAVGRTAAGVATSGDFAACRSSGSGSSSGSSSGSGGFAACGGSSSPAKVAKGPKAVNMIDTFSSKVPLKWAASAVHAPTSSYTTSYGGNLGRTPQMFKTVFKEVNVGFGHVDQHQYPTASALYPVEQLYLQQALVPDQQEKEADYKTTQRMSYKPRDPEDVARSIVAAKEQIEASQAARNKSFIPLSKAGIQFGSSAQWRSTYGADFIPRKADLSGNKATASAVAGMFNGPTIAYGKIAGMRAEDLAKIAKHKAEQAAIAAARAQAEAELDKRVAASKQLSVDGSH